MLTGVALGVSLGLFARSLALGINCQGSVVCFLASFENSQNVDIIQGLRDQIYSTNLSVDTQYGDGEHITCVGNSININIGPDEFHLGGSIPAGAICAFPQDMHGKKLSLAQIRTLADALIDHECSTCGSIPISYLQSQDGDVKDGQLTFNFVSQSNADCEGNCISSGHNDGSDNNTTQQSATSVATITKTADSTTSSSMSETRSVSRFSLSSLPSMPSEPTDSNAPSTTVVSQNPTGNSSSPQATVTVTANMANSRLDLPNWIQFLMSWILFAIVD